MLWCAHCVKGEMQLNMNTHHELSMHSMMMHAAATNRQWSMRVASLRLTMMVAERDTGQKC